MSENEIAVTGTFADRIKSRIQDSIGELMTDEELKLIIERGVEETFFQGKTNYSGYGRSTDVPPLIHSMVRDILTERINVALQGWLNSHEEETKEIIALSLEKNAGDLMLKSITHLFQNEMNQFKYSIENKLGSL